MAEASLARVRGRGLRPRALATPAAAPVHGLGWVLGALAVAVVPHARALPAWVLLLLLAIGAWRYTAAGRNLALSVAVEW